MNITQITVSYGETQSLPEYSNVKPAITLTAVLDQDDDAQAVENDLWLQAKLAVREQIDLALEANGKAAKWSDEPRYQVLRTYWHEWSHRGETKPPQYVVIAPNHLDLERKARVQQLSHFGPGEARKLRYEHARRVVEALMLEESDYTLIDCADGDLGRIDAVLPLKSAEAPPAAADDLSDEDRRGYQQADDEEDGRDLDEIDDDEE